MIKSLALGAVLGGLVAFLWSAVSWMMLPWHNAGMKSFTNEATVAQVVLDNVPTGGMFLLPGIPPGYEQMSADQRKMADAARATALANGPYMYAVVWRGLSENMGKQMGLWLLFNMLAALLVSMLVMKTGGMSWGGRVMFVVTAAVAVCLIAVIPNWIWWRYPREVILVTMADIVIAWLLAGMVIAKVAAPPRAA